jgi:hypothetical protein
VRGRFDRIAAGLALVLAAFACAPKREVRIDVAPLALRLALPANVRDLRWMAIAEHEEGCIPSIPEPDARTLVYAAIRLDADGWRAIEARAPKRERGAATLPADVARAILPPESKPTNEGGRATVAGDVLNGSGLQKAEHVAVRSAVRAGDVLLLELLLSN